MELLIYNQLTFKKWKKTVGQIYVEEFFFPLMCINRRCIVLPPVLVYLLQACFQLELLLIESLDQYFNDPVIQIYRYICNLCSLIPIKAILPRRLCLFFARCRQNKNTQVKTKNVVYSVNDTKHISKEKGVTENM